MPRKQVRPLRVKTPFAVGNRVYRRGQLVRSDDEHVKGREHLFVDVLDVLNIEMAVAVPSGEKRTKKENNG